MILKFNFEPAVKDDFVNVSSSKLYSKDKGYGFETFKFRVDVPNSNYDVKLVLRNLKKDVAMTNIMVFPRRIMVKDAQIRLKSQKNSLSMQSRESILSFLKV